MSLFNIHCSPQSIKPTKSTTGCAGRPLETSLFTSLLKTIPQFCCMNNVGWHVYTLSNVCLPARVERDPFFFVEGRENLDKIAFT